jgi:hypothetical protein
MNITDEMLDAFVLAFRTTPYVDVADVHVRERAALAAVAPLIAAQAALAERVKIATEVRQHAERVARTLGSSRAASIAVAAIENEVADRINTLTDACCCDQPNMVWEHSRAGKDHFRCAGCGGGMTKARATDA